MKFAGEAFRNMTLQPDPGTRIRHMTSWRELEPLLKATLVVPTPPAERSRRRQAAGMSTAVEWMEKSRSKTLDARRPATPPDNASTEECDTLDRSCRCLPSVVVAHIQSMRACATATTCGPGSGLARTSAHTSRTNGSESQQRSKPRLLSHSPAPPPSLPTLLPRRPRARIQHRDPPPEPRRCAPPLPLAFGGMGATTAAGTG
jgi:hypothetical protein